MPKWPFSLFSLSCTRAKLLKLFSVISSPMSPSVETRQEIEEYHSENTVGYLDGVQQRRVLSPLNVKSSSPNADFLVPPISSLSPQVKPGPPDFQHQMPITEYQVKQAEVHLESQSSAIVGPKTIQTLSLSPTVKCPPTRKRPADEPTLDRYSTSNPQLEDPLPKYYKPTCSQPSSESASESSLVNPAATPPPPVSIGPGRRT